MALTEPINIDDVVIIEGEQVIEDIRTTYVVVKIWDERLIVPTSPFIEGAFQGVPEDRAIARLGHALSDPATRSGRSARVPAPDRRQSAWDRRVQVVQVTETTRDAIEVRLLMSKVRPLFDLRCDIREGMLAWLADHQPEHSLA